MRRRLVIGSLATWLRARSGFAAPAENALVLRVQKTGYYGITPGPSLRAKRGEEFEFALSMNWTSQLPYTGTASA
ncbi:MAG: hypothetical protein WBE48_03200 [Xanthobacteraceae bacterium]